MDAKKLLAKYHIDEKTGFLYRYICSDTERFLPHNHDFCEIFLTLSGEILHYANGEAQRLREGSLVFIRPDDIHTYIPEKNNKYIFINFAFNTETANELFNYLSDGFESKKLLTQKMPPIIYLDKYNTNKLVSEFQQLNTLKWKDNSKYKYRMRILLAEIFSKYFSDYSNFDKNNIPQWLDNFSKQLNLKENFASDTDSIIKLSGKSREHLSRSIKKYYGVSLTQYINEQRLNYTANMLINSNIPILDICFESGFENVSWFYEKFKQRFNTSPKSFRKKYKPGNSIFGNTKYSAL